MNQKILKIIDLNTVKKISKTCNPYAKRMKIVCIYMRFVCKTV